MHTCQIGIAAGGNDYRSVCRPTVITRLANSPSTTIGRSEAYEQMNGEVQSQIVSSEMSSVRSLIVIAHAS